MKRIIYLSVVLLILSACNSSGDRPSSIVIGDEKGMNVIDFDYTFTAVWVGKNDINKRTHRYDMNGDGDDDFSLTSFLDTIYDNASGINELSYGVYFKVEGNNAKTQYSTNNITETITDRDTTFTGSSWPVSYLLRKYNCNLNGEFSYYGDIYKYISKLVKGAEINNDVWDYNDDQPKYIYHSNYNTFANNKLDKFDFSCFNADYNSSIFIPIQLSPNSSYDNYLGWVELEIIDESTVHLIRTAIQK